MRTPEIQAQSMREAWSQDQLSAHLTPAMGFCHHHRRGVSAWQIEHMYAPQSLPQVYNLNVGTKVTHAEKDSGTPFHARI